MNTPTNEIRSLAIEQATMLWCMRLWVAGRQLGIRNSARIERLAAQLDAPEAGPFIEGFMAALNRGAARSIEVGCLHCVRIGADERLLLDALGLAQERRTFEALLLLARLVDAEAARAAVLNAEGLGAALARMGRFLPAPDMTSDRFDVATWFSRER